RRYVHRLPRADAHRSARPQQHTGCARHQADLGAHGTGSTDESTSRLGTKARLRGPTIARTESTVARPRGAGDEQLERPQREPRRDLALADFTSSAVPRAQWADAMVVG